MTNEEILNLLNEISQTVKMDDALMKDVALAKRELNRKIKAKLSARVKAEEKRK